MSYEPRGKVAVLLAAMRAAPEKIVWTADELAQTMEVAKGNLPPYLQAVCTRGMLYRRIEGGRSYFSLHEFPADWRAPFVPAKMTPPRGVTGEVARAPLPAPLAASIPAPILTLPKPPELPELPAPIEVPPLDEIEEEAEFDASLWLNGDLDLFGLVELDNGAYRVPAEKVARLRKLLAWMPA
jgi:hypothetical protein